MVGAFEVSGERVIVFGRDRVEFMIVAAGAGDRQAEERLAEDVDLIVRGAARSSAMSTGE